MDSECGCFYGIFYEIQEKQKSMIFARINIKRSANILLFTEIVAVVWGALHGLNPFALSVLSGSIFMNIGGILFNLTQRIIPHKALVRSIEWMPTASYEGRIAQYPHVLLHNEERTMNPEIIQEICNVKLKPHIDNIREIITTLYADRDEFLITRIDDIVVCRMNFGFVTIKHELTKRDKTSIIVDLVRYASERKLVSGVVAFGCYALSAIPALFVFNFIPTV